MTNTLSSLEIELPQIRRTLGLSLLLLIVGLSTPGYGGTSSAERNASQAKAPRKVSFRKDIRPIFDANCTFCHLTTSPHGQIFLDGNYVLQTLVNQPSVLSKSLRVVPGKPDESFLIHKIEALRPGIGYRMPVDVALYPDQIKLIRKWIEEGALDN